MHEKQYHTGELADKSFLVTGGAGFIGSNLVEYLLTFGAKFVRVLDNFSTGSYENVSDFALDNRFELIRGDIRDFKTCEKAIKGIDYVSHQAALGSVPRSINDPIQSNDVNVSGFLNMLVAAKEAKVRRFVYAASSSTYGDHPSLPKVEEIIGNPLSPYAITKYVNELYANVFSKLYGFHTIGLRYFNVFGAKQSATGAYSAVIPIFIQSALNNRQPAINGDGHTSRDFTYIENVVQANIKAMLIESSAKNEIFNIAYGTSTTLNELWNTIAALVGVGFPPKYLDERLGDVRHSLADISKAKAALDYQPLYSVAEGLAETVRWYENAFNITRNQ